MKQILEIRRLAPVNGKRPGWEVRRDEGKKYIEGHLGRIQHMRSFKSKFLLLAYIKAKVTK